ncbi:MAG: SH3 domain-containing protein [Planctomycetia bacterium]|nr:SH3 domain-containing protein [Planctomycetia bacterium]
MRWCSFLFAILALGARNQALGIEFPYAAYVNSADVYVRSGPGRDYYPTDKLQKGAKVEVYRHDPGGWYAIRPPRQSFSWVSSRHLDPAGNGLATVNSPRVVARVGSAFSDVRDVIQVRLDKGEKVELVDSPASDSPWCKISPPSGEFRWVFSKYVDRDGAAEVARDEQDALPGEESSIPRAAERPERGIRLASGLRESQPTTDDPDARVSAAAEPPDSPGSAALRREIDRIELELSAMVVEEISVWSFDRLQNRAEALLDEAQTPLQRGRVRVLLTKLARFEDIKQRHLSVRHMQEDTDRANSQLGGSEPHRPEAPRFDGVGRLSPVISEKVGGPQFALVDQSNAVVSFITAAPGVNLRPFVDKYVGVNGQRGYMTDLHRQHINVQRVTLLDVQRR